MNRFLIGWLLMLAALSSLTAQSRLKVEGGLTAGFENNLFRGPSSLLRASGEELSASDFHSHAWVVRPRFYVYRYQRWDRHRLTLRGNLQADWFPFFEIANRAQSKVQAVHRYRLGKQTDFYQEAELRFRQRFQNEGLPDILSFPYNYRIADYAVGMDWNLSSRDRLQGRIKGRRKSMSDEDQKALSFWEAGVLVNYRHERPVGEGAQWRLEGEVQRFFRQYNRVSPLFDPDEGLLNEAPGEEGWVQEEQFSRRYLEAEGKVSALSGGSWEVSAGFRYRHRHNPGDTRFDFTAGNATLKAQYQLANIRLEALSAWGWKHYLELIPAGLDAEVRYRSWTGRLEAEQQLFPGMYLHASLRYENRRSNADRPSSLAFRSYRTWGVQIGGIWRWEKVQRK